MDALILTEEGYYATLGKSGARMEMPGCSLCMGNQAQIRKGSTAISTSTRNFPNRLGIDTQVYLSSAELAAVRAGWPHRDGCRVHGADQAGQCQVG
jgi:aconitate hydratase 2 / 2-methylisocitrate dehydratase